MVINTNDELRAANSHPDDWIKIPEFNVLPQDVGFRGFDCPIVIPMLTKAKSCTSMSLSESIGCVIQAIRTEAKRRFASLADLQAASAHVYADDNLSGEATNDEMFATAYTYIFQQLERWIVAYPKSRVQSNCELASIASSMSFMFSHSRDGSKSIQEVRQEFARRGAMMMLANSTKQRDKATVRECWDAWQKRLDSYKGKAAFARDMREKFPNLESQPVIEGWCRAWERASKPSPS